MPVAPWFGAGRSIAVSGNRPHPTGVNGCGNRVATARLFRASTRCGVATSIAELTGPLPLALPQAQSAFMAPGLSASSVE
jgi:hypothetical protein